MADLMTALAVVGLACAILVAGRSVSPSSIDVLQAQNDSLIAEVDNLNAELARKEIGFLPCWRGNDPGDYYRTYNVTVQDGRFSFSPHEHWALGTDLRRTIPQSVVSVLGDFPRGDVGGEQVVSFGERVDHAVREEGYPADCKMVVTINAIADGHEIGILTRAGFFPVWR